MNGSIEKRKSPFYATVAIRLAPFWSLLAVFLFACLGLGSRLNGLSWGNVGWVAYGVAATLGLPAVLLGGILSLLDWFRPDLRMAWATITFVLVIVAAGFGMVLGVALDF